MVPAAELLDLPMWLRLSRLFMYQSPELGDSWDNFITSGHETPSIYHTAFQDFHNLTVSLTRRVVQATIFQTMTRLRARDKDQPSARVTTTDVRAATEILDLQSNARKFWARVPRKHGLRVYERGSKFSRGQSRAGVELSLEEAEDRLGAGQTSVVAEADDDVMETVEDDSDEDVLDPDQYYNDPELWTEASDEEDETQTDVPDNQHSDASDEDEAAYNPTDDEEAQDATRKKRRRKGRMERNFQRVHDAYLEAVDQEISRVQEVTMWDTLGVAPPNDIKNEEIEIPLQPVIKRRLSDTANWRDGFEYRSPWELGFDTVQPETFASMHKRGEQARKRRRMAYDYLEREGLVVLPQQAPEVTVVKKTKATDTDTDMQDAPADEPPRATIETFDDGVPRKKRPAPVHKALSRASSILSSSRGLSRASSVREGSHDSLTSERSGLTNLALLNKLTKRTPAQQMEEGLRKAEEERKAEEARQQVEEQVQEEKRKARATRKALSKEEKVAFDRERQEERARKAQETRRNEERRREKEEQEEMERLAAEEKRKVREEKRRAREEVERGRDERRKAKIEKRKAKEEAASADTNIEQQGDLARSLRSRKAKRKSGF
ncbi:unnamed protein product [Aureobasidium mustum]|uniref:Uncharacterized protein n=1 Tax=Aureobasidium mustum TaxID=2773714 RepID=A0A9N8K3S4_9PEZI|nr:unnamed protein product [Aureobasidium mustum]